MGWGAKAPVPAAPPGPLKLRLLGGLLLQHNGHLVVRALEQDHGRVGDEALLLGSLERAAEGLKDVLRLVKQLAKGDLWRQECVGRGR